MFLGPEICEAFCFVKGAFGLQFTSMAFMAFLAAAFLLHWALPERFRWALCLAASFVFYGLFGLPMLGVLLGCIAASYCGGLWLAKHQGQKPALALAMVLTLLPLCTYKYFDGLTAWLGFAPTKLSLLTPVGISFFTFKLISYLVEVWRGSLPVQRHFGKYALYVSFFPQVSSGPIQRPADLLGQIDAPHPFVTAQAIEGAQLMLWGFFKKLVIADNLATYVQVGFLKPQTVIGGSVVIAAVLYSIQLYCDFSGYSDIAIGCMNLFGYTVPANFKSPYFAVSIKDFWARWHISLSSFLRDYVYFPLGGSRKGTVRTCINLLLTFFISGLWHGTGLQFIVWGTLHGVYQVAGRLTQPLRSKAWALCRISEQSRLARSVKMLVTFGLVTIGWVFFGARDLPMALALFAKMPDSFSLSLQNAKNSLMMLGINTTVLLRFGVCIAVLFVVDYCCRESGFSAWLSARKRSVQIIFCYVLLFALIFMAPAAGGGFIYFNF